MRKCKTCKKTKNKEDFVDSPNLYIYCKKCRVQYVTQYKRNYYLEKGLCIACGKPAKPNKQKCQLCYDKQQAKRTIWRRNIKRKAVEYLGNRCADCGNSFSHQSVYEFHHIDKKLYTIAGMITKGDSWDKIKPELDRCVLLCANCHRIRHSIEDEKGCVESLVPLETTGDKKLKVKDSCGTQSTVNHIGTNRQHTISASMKSTKLKKRRTH